MTMTQDNIVEVVQSMPYGPEFHFVDSIIDTDGERYIITRKRYNENSAVVHAHRTVGSLVPGVILIEQAAQSALVLGRIKNESREIRNAVLGQIKAKFKNTVVAPATVDAELFIRFHDSKAIGFNAYLKSGGELCAEVAGVCMFVEVDGDK